MGNSVSGPSEQVRGEEVEQVEKEVQHLTERARKFEVRTHVMQTDSSEDSNGHTDTSGPTTTLGKYLESMDPEVLLAYAEARMRQRQTTSIGHSTSSVAAVKGHPRDPTSATSKENNQTPGPPPPVPPPTQSAGAIVSQAQSSRFQLDNSAVPQTNSAPQRDSLESDIYRYSGPKPLFAAAWANKNDRRIRLAVGSIVEREQGNNVILIELDENLGQFVERGSFSHEFPANKIEFIPDLENKYPDLLATSADFLRLWRIHPNNLVTEEAVLSSNKSSQYTAPLTNFDWNEVDPRLIGNSSIDTTCTIYDVEVQQAVGLVRPITFSVKTQLIAHDKPVHDIAFSRIFNGKDNFATVGADGSARMFDLRHLEHPTIVYEDPLKLPLMRVAWNKQEHYQLATFAQDSKEVIIIDIRMPCNPLARLKSHSDAVNGLAWAPHSAHQICTASDDAQVLIWNLQNMPEAVEDSILAYSAGGKVKQVQWGPAHNDWICICFNKSLEILHV